MAHELTHVLQQRQARSGLHAPSIQRKVFRCCREVQTGRSIIDTAAAMLGLEHCWLKTGTKVVGMGPAQEGPLPAWPFGIDTKTTDHSKETPQSCQEMRDTDEYCVNQELQIGKPTGKWGVRNNCNTFADNIVSMCRLSTEGKVQVVNQLFDGWVSDDDIKLIRKVYQNTPAFQRSAVKKAIERRIPDLTDIGQRTQVRVILQEGR